MKKIHSLMTAVLMSLVLPHATAAQAPALQSGSMLIGGTVHATVESDDDADNRTTISVLPRVEYFVANGLSLGGQAGVSYAKVGDASGTALILGPTLGYYFMRQGRVHPFVRASGDYSRSTFSSDAGGEISSTGVGVTGAAGVLFMLHEAVGVDAQLFLSRHRQEQGDLERTRTLGGLRLGISAFVF